MNLEIKDLTVEFGDKTILDNVSHTFKEGKITMLLGPNGCGKTTFIRSIVRKFADLRCLSYIPQEIYGNIGLTVEDTVALGRYNSKKFLAGYTEEDVKHINDAISLMQLEDRRRQLFDTLSGGEKQRCMAARSICQDAEWFIMDEPSSSLDIVHSKFILDTARELVKNSGKSFIIVMHDINSAAAYGDEFVLMRDGHIVNVTGELTSEILQDVYGTPFGCVKTPSGKDVFYTE